MGLGRILSECSLFALGRSVANCVSGIFSQSNFGIVTKMGMALMPNPGGHEAFVSRPQTRQLRYYQIAANNLHRCTPFPTKMTSRPWYVPPKPPNTTVTPPAMNTNQPSQMEIIRPLRIAQILENVAQVRHVTQSLAARGLPRTAYHTGAGPIPPATLHAAAAATPIGDHAWAYYGMAYGPPHIRAHKLTLIDAEFRRIPGAKKIDPSTLPPDEYFFSRARVASGVPDIHELRWVNWQPNGAHIAFSPVSPIRGRDAMRLFELGKRKHEEYGIDFFPAFCVGLREMHLIVEIVFDRADGGSKVRALECLRDLVDEAAREGYGEYRTHLVLMDQVAGTYSWNDGALMKFNERLKDALDPNGILAPGRCGIWPKRYRGRGWEMTRESNGRSEGNGVDAA